MKRLLIVLLLPVVANAQNVEPVTSKDYLQIIQVNRHSEVFFIDTTNNAKNALLTLARNYNGAKIKKINVRNQYLKIKPAISGTLFLSGSFNSTVELKSANRLPSLQTQYSQGRSINGTLAWQGPETDELFSFGPPINKLEFDGSNYSFDSNGKLVQAGSGNGEKLNAYKNKIFRTASSLSNSLLLQGRYESGGQQYLIKIKLGQSKENTFIENNINASQNLSTAFEATLKTFKISSTFNAVRETFSNSNRNGFLNRVYQNSILTPISFDNTQGTTIGNYQRSYSREADNPFFLLNNNGNSYLESHNSGNLVIEKQSERFKMKVVQSIERLGENSSEGYKAGTAFFPNGTQINRKKTNENYFLNPSLSYDIKFDNYNFRSNITASDIYGNSRSNIIYNTGGYNYQRSSNDFLVSYTGSYDAYNFETGIKAEDKFYSSNTSLKSDYFLPGGSVYFQVNDLSYGSQVALKLTSTFNKYYSELSIGNSYSQINLTRYTPEQTMQYLPVTEVTSFNGLLPIQHQDWSSRIELSYKSKLSLKTEVFNRKISNDIVPVHENRAFNLKNIFSHQNKGFELELTYNSSRNPKKVSSNNSISFSTYKDLVTDVVPGFDFTPIAGFQNIYKAIVKRNAVGSIVGTTFLKDKVNNVVIGDDGFPIVNTNPSVIGNPTPDFVMKMSNQIIYKRFSLNLDWEWKKGGDVWNGTQSVLDYYGRSQATGTLRNTTNYIFPGVLANGHPNNIPVDFYNPNLPVDENRWVRYGYTGVTEDYIERGDEVRINNIAIVYKLMAKKYVQSIAFSLYANNIILWTPYKGVEPNQLLFDQFNSNGLDFFNLPSLKTFGFNVSFQF